MEFGKILKQLRIEKGMTQKALAAKLDVTDSAIRLWESHGREPNFSTVIKLAEIFEVTIGQLLGTEEY